MAYCSDQNTYWLTQEIYIQEDPLCWLGKNSGAPTILIRIIKMAFVYNYKEQSNAALLPVKLMFLGILT